MEPEDEFKRPAYLDDKSLGQIFEFLIDLRAKSDPVYGQSSESEKHYNAQQAIVFTGLLIDSLCGWASDHIIGTVKEEFNKVPSSGAADDHRFECSGRGYEPGNAETDREILAKLISIGGIVPSALRGSLQNALQALNTGEVLDLARPAPTGMWWSPHSLAGLRLLAVCHVILRWGHGGTKKKAQEDVAKCLGVSPATLRTWETTWLPKIHGASVKATYKIAKRAGALSLWMEAHPGQPNEDRTAFVLLMTLEQNPVERIAQTHRRLQQAGSSER